MLQGEKDTKNAQNSVNISYAITISNILTGLFLRKRKANLLYKNDVVMKNISKNVQKQAF